MRSVLTALALLFAAGTALAADSNLFVDKNPSVYLFYMTDCPYSREARKFLANEAKKDAQLRVVELNVDTSEAFQDLLMKVYDRIGLPGLGVVPLAVVGNHFQIGYDGDEAGKQILNDVAQCRKEGCRDYVGEMMNELTQMATPLSFSGRISKLSTAAPKVPANSIAEAKAK